MTSIYHTTVIGFSKNENKPTVQFHVSKLDIIEKLFILVFKFKQEII